MYCHMCARRGIGDAVAVPAYRDGKLDNYECVMGHRGVVFTNVELENGRVVKTMIVWSGGRQGS